MRDSKSRCRAEPLPAYRSPCLPPNKSLSLTAVLAPFVICPALATLASKAVPGGGAIMTKTWSELLPANNTRTPRKPYGVWEVGNEWEDASHLETLASPQATARTRCGTLPARAYLRPNRGADGARMSLYSCSFYI
ncbi:hypothetical protein LX32DRAFT_109497 [Colletotrichum zoysiae]|uniref:Uncharacterized protein n=1 Tax=Colletotrichum zoysiae TaxID=1216348 RepID=A0AAD9LX43_9PEZI|nr:hypothetical protein LX32DRAFT_109497 [Colletotrichum zoysiae]